MLKRKVKKTIMLLLCSMLLFSGLIINHGSIKKLSIIDFPPMINCVKHYIPFVL